MISPAVKRLIQDASIPAPARETEFSAGFDLRSSMSVNIKPGEQALIKTGFAWAIPPGSVGLIRDRSGHAFKYRMTTRAGVIDADYRGEVGVVLTNEGENDYTVAQGERVAQMIIVPCMLLNVVEVDDLDDTPRGAGGYGSTGR